MSIRKALQSKIDAYELVSKRPKKVRKYYRKNKSEKIVVLCCSYHYYQVLEQSNHQKPIKIFNY